MIDLHTHTLLSDGALLPSEMVRRALVAGYEAIGLTDHVDSSNIDFVLPRLVKVCEKLNMRWNILALPGVEITHVPLEDIAPLVKYSRRHRARIVIVHGETPSEPVIQGTNRAGIEAGADIIAHPGLITREDAQRAAKKGVLLELTARKAHASTNAHVAKIAVEAGCGLVVNTDAHSHEDFMNEESRLRLLTAAGLKAQELDMVNAATRGLLERARR
jgi:histidinol phosphatase-like PHP family hydrolase